MRELAHPIEIFDFVFDAHTDVHFVVSSSNKSILCSSRIRPNAKNRISRSIIQHLESHSLTNSSADNARNDDYTDPRIFVHGTNIDPLKVLHDAKLNESKPIWKDYQADELYGQSH
eukprot:279648_1